MGRAPARWELFPRSHSCTARGPHMRLARVNTRSRAMSCAIDCWRGRCRPLIHRRVVEALTPISFASPALPNTSASERKCSSGSKRSGWVSGSLG